MIIECLHFFPNIKLICCSSERVGETGSFDFCFEEFQN